MIPFDEYTYAADRPYMYQSPNGIPTYTQTDIHTTLRATSVAQ